MIQPTRQASMRTQQRSTNRRAFTLVELLIVMGILVLLAAVTLPSLKGLMGAQKFSQASQIVSTYVESAKSRAVATGRPVALILDRTRYDSSMGLIGNNMCTRLSIGDVFPAYSGDWAGANGTLGPSGGTVFNQLRIPVSMVASIDPAGNALGLAQAGDTIEIGARRQRFTITGLVRDGSDVVIGFANPPAYSETALLGTTSPDGQTFRIYRKPSKSLAGGVSLPRGTCIDLHFSGFGTTGRQLSSDAIHWDTLGAIPTNYPPADDTQFPNYGPIYIVFSPEGTVEAWYYQQRDRNNLSAAALVRGFPTGIIHLLVGATDQVPQSPRIDGGAALLVEDDYQTNIMDGKNYWVSINPFTGGVNTSQVQSPPVSFVPTAVDVRVAEARSMATNFIATP